MSNRTDLQAMLEQILGSRNVYYQPPASVQMNYPAIVYSRKNIENSHADDAVYIQSYSYEVTYIDNRADSRVAFELSKLPKCRFDREYIADNLYHYVYVLYF